MAVTDLKDPAPAAQSHNAPGAPDAPDAPDWHARLAELVPAIEAGRDAAERARRLPQEMVDALRDAGFYRMWVPRRYGGYEAEPAVMLEVVEELARHDPSLAWSMMASVNSALLAARLPEEGGIEIFADPQTVVAGSLHRGGVAVPAPGGHILTGRWRLASACMEASWLIATAAVGTTPEAAAESDGEPHIFFVPAAQARFIDDWHAIGLRGSGSNSFAVEDVFVPDHRHIVPGAPLVVDGPLYRGPLAHFINPPLGALALGIAADAVAAFVELAQKKTARGNSLPLSERHSIQDRVGEASCLISAARAYLHAATATLWDEARAGAPLGPAITREIMASTAVAAKNAVAAVSLVYTAAGSTSIFQTSRLERCFRDVNVVNHHDAASQMVIERVGRHILTGK